MVVRLEMWPHGRQDAARTLAVATFACAGKEGAERFYDVKLLKSPEYGGPRVDVPLMDPDVAAAIKSPGSAVWRQGRVGGHVPGPRGPWDLLGGALVQLLGAARLASYRLHRRGDP
jgi:hypothetical protein